MDFIKTTILDLIERANDKALVLPNFQRNYVWTSDQQRLLIASFIVNLPIGTFLTLEGRAGEFLSRQLCYKPVVTPSDSCYYLLDGQQRLSTVKSVFSDLFGYSGWESKFDDLFYHLRKRWYLDLNEENCKIAFGYNHLQFKQKLDPNSSNLTSYVSRMEPNELLDSIKFVQLFKKKKDHPFHPGRKFTTSSPDQWQKEIELSYLFSNDGLIPLYDFLSPNKNLVKTTLKQLAERRILELQNIVDQDQVNGYIISKEYLGHLDSEISNKYQNQNTQEINNLWQILKDKWVDDVLEYFKDLFKSELVVPNIKSNELSRATSVFEYMNKGGTPLDTFDIMVAKYATVGAQETLYDKLETALRDKFDIPKSLSKKGNVIPDFTSEEFGIYSEDVLSKQVKELFLNIISLNTVNDIDSIDLSYIKKEKILKLSQTEIDFSLENSSKALKRGLAFLQFRCGIHAMSNLSYSLMLLPISLLLQNDDVWKNEHHIDKIEFWYWTSLFSGRYREKQNQRSISDYKELYTWILNSGPGADIISRKENIFKESNYSDENTLLLKNEDKVVASAIHFGILQYILSLSVSDFDASGQPKKLNCWDVSSECIKLQDHHIIPLGSVSTLGESTKLLRKDKGNILNSPLNRTYITQQSNQKINNLSIDRYATVLAPQILESHLVPTTIDLAAITPSKQLQEDFMKQRFNLLKNSISQELTALLR